MFLRSSGRRRRRLLEHGAEIAETLSERCVVRPRRRCKERHEQCRSAAIGAIVSGCWRQSECAMLREL
jgi:hypothetical protein